MCNLYATAESSAGSKTLPLYENVLTPLCLRCWELIVDADRERLSLRWFGHPFLTARTPGLESGNPCAEMGQFTSQPRAAAPERSGGAILPASCLAKELIPCGGDALPERPSVGLL